VESLLVVPGIALNLCAVFGAVLTLSIVAARFRDVQLIVSTILQLVFLVTPIMWESKSLRGAAIGYVADFNPFYHLIELVRLPLLGKAPPLGSWIFSGFIVIVCLLVGHYIYARYRHRIAFWV
jgi:ABC-type polysaccharide/polyol phosphate export permease